MTSERLHQDRGYIASNAGIQKLSSTSEQVLFTAWFGIYLREGTKGIELPRVARARQDDAAEEDNNAMAMESGCKRKRVVFYQLRRSPCWPQRCEAGVVHPFSVSVVSHREPRTTFIVQAGSHARWILVRRGWREACDARGEIALHF